IPPGAISSTLMARMNCSAKTHVLWRQLGQAVRVGDILVDEEAAPTPLNGVEMFPVKGNTRTDDLHITRAVVAQWLAGAVWGSVFALQGHLLFQQKIHQFGVGREFEAQRSNHLFVEVVKRVLLRFRIHSTHPRIRAPSRRPLADSRR